VLGLTNIYGGIAVSGGAEGLDAICDEREGLRREGLGNWDRKSSMLTLTNGIVSSGSNLDNIFFDASTVPLGNGHQNEFVNNHWGVLGERTHAGSKGFWTNTSCGISAESLLKEY